MSTGERQVVEEERALHRRKLFALMASSAAICVSVGIGGNAVAQTNDNTVIGTATDAKDDANIDTSEIVVTGTSLRGVAPVGSPLIQLGRDEIVHSGAQTGAALFATIPQLDSFGSRPNQGGNVNVFTPPTLRGLPAGSTLSLLNGHRLVAVGTIATVADPSTIPLAAVERLEVLADGASATYGSDAIGGVVNLILRRDFDGIEASGLIGVGESYRERTASLVAGKTWDTGSFLVAYENYHNSALLGRDRDYVSANLSGIGGFDARSPFSSAPNVIADGQNFYYTGSGFEEGQLLVDDQRLTDIIPGSDRHTAIANFRQDLSDRVHLFGDANYGNIKTKARLAPSIAYVTINDSNPYFQTPVPGVTSETLLYRFDKEMGPYNYHRTALEYYGASLGADVEINDNWHGQVFGNYGHSNTVLTLNALGSPNGGLVQAALNSTDPATALDPFGGMTSAATVAGFLENPNVVQSRQKLYQAGAKVDGSLMSMPGGDVKLALGTEYRRETYFGQNDGGLPSSPFHVGRGSDRDVYSAYGEVYIPLIGEDSGVSFIHRLAVDATLRYDHYSDFGSTTNPKIGVELAPVEALTLRGSYSKSFQAPSLADLNSIDAQAVFLPQIYIPNIYTPVEPGLYNVLLLAGGNPDLEPQKATTFTVGGDLKIGSNFRFSATYYNVRYSNAINYALGAYTNPELYTRFITKDPTQAQIDAAVALYPSAGGIPIPAGELDYIADLRRFNLGKQNIEGLDFGPQFNLDGVGNGVLQLGFNANYILKNESQPAPGTAFVDNLENLPNPKLRVRGFVNWLNGPFTANLFVNHVGKYNNTGVAPVQRVKTFTTVDVNLGYEFPGNSLMDGLALQLNVQNLFDQDPPVYYSTPGYNQQFASPVGRLIQVGARVKF